VPKIIEERRFGVEGARWPIKLDPCGIKWLREYYVVNAGCIG
jgi:hypothetical protein